MVPLWHHLSSLHFMPITLLVSQFRFGEFVPVLARSSFITKATRWLIIETVLITFTARKRSCGKVSFLQVCVCSRRGGGEYLLLGGVSTHLDTWDTTGYGQQVDGTHPTEILSCTEPVYDDGHQVFDCLTCIRVVCSHFNILCCIVLQNKSLNILLSGITTLHILGLGK